MTKIKANIPTPLDSLSAETKKSAVLKKGDMHASTAHILRNLIVAGAIGPGEKLNERELCERLNVSRTPVREAIKTLAQEGLLDIQPNRSPTVTRLDAEETAALIDVVSAIEALAGELAAARITEAETAELGILHYTMLKHKGSATRLFQSQQSISPIDTGIFRKPSAALGLGLIGTSNRSRALRVKFMARTLGQSDG